MNANLRPALLDILLASCAFYGPQARAQEIDCTVQVSYEAVAAMGKELLSNFSGEVSDYVNNYKWGQDNLDQKIKCTLNIFIQGISGEDRYQAQVFIGSQRPVYGSQKSSAVVRLLDESWEFTYVKGRPINHNPYTFNDLASFLDFYVNLVIGYDYDTYENMSGTPFFQKASEIASLGRSSGQKGWQLTTGSYTRTQLIEEILNPKYAPVRRASCIYHFTGLDSLSANPDVARKNVLTALELIGKVRKETDPRNIIIKSFFETKHLEIADLFADVPDRTVYVKLGTIDPFHLKTYNEYMTRRR